MSAREQIDRLFEQPLIEVGLSRALSHFNSREFGQISADRDEYTSAEKESARAALEQALKKLGLGFVTMDGVGQEVRNGQTVPTKERSLFVPNVTQQKQALPDFRQILLNLAAQFKQNYVVHGLGDGKVELLTPDGTVADKWNSFKTHPDRYYSGLRHGLKGKNFHYESIERAYPGEGNPRWLNGLAWEARGEIIDPVEWMSRGERRVEEAANRAKCFVRPIHADGSLPLP